MTSHSSFDMLAGHLRTLVRALESGKPDGRAQPGPGSDADAETLHESLAVEWGESPVRDAHSHIRLLCISASDHVLALANLLESVETGAFVAFTVGRGILEAAGRAWFLAEPGLDERERVRRYMNEMLWNLEETRRFIGNTDTESALPEDQVATIREAAQAHGFPVGKTRFGLQLGEERPAVMKVCDQLLSDENAGYKFGSATYQFLSASAHGAASGLAGHLDDSVGRTTSIVKQSNRQARSLIGPMTAYVLMGNRFLEYYGWQRESWDVARDEALAAWHSHALPGQSH